MGKLITLLSKHRSGLVREALLVGVPMLAFLALLVVVAKSAPTGFDRSLAGSLQSLSWGPQTTLAGTISDVGGGPWGFYVIPALVAVFLAAKREWRLLVPLVAVFALHFVAISPKAFIPAFRPSPEFGVLGAGGMESFPSGHSQWATSFYGLLAYIAWRRTGGNLRYLVIGLYAAVVILTMLSRIELGRHWPTDTVAGLLIGLVTLRLLIALHSGAERWRPSPRTMAF
ncbi:MAG: phosphatase PAP2 family protein [Dehalococcoidia bacterium]